MDWSTGSIYDARGYVVSESGYLLGEYVVANGGVKSAYWSRLDTATSTGWVVQQGLVPKPGFDDCWARGVAMVGQQTVATGWLRPSHGQTGDDFGYTWIIGAPGATVFQVNAKNTQPYGINASGLVAGLAGLFNETGFRVLPAQQPTILQPLPGYVRCWANGLNLPSVAVGTSADVAGQWQATAWLPATGSTRALEWLDPQYRYAEALGVNRAAHAVGFSRMDDPNTPVTTDYRAVLWSSVTPTDLGVLTLPTQLHTASKALAISDGIPGVLEEEVVGTSWDNSTTPASGHHAFVWDAVTGMRDLTSLVPNGTPPSSANHWYGFGFNPPYNVVLEQATAINSLGEIAAIAYLGGRYHAVLLTPDLASPRLGRMQAPFVGAQTTMHGIGFTPGTALELLYDFGTGNHLMPGCSTAKYMQLDPSNSPTLAFAVADQRGRVEFRFTVPTVDFSTGLFLQAFDRSGCDLSNVVAETVQ